jgi:hypothetical protein
MGLIIPAEQIENGVKGKLKLDGLSTRTVKVIGIQGEGILVEQTNKKLSDNPHPYDGCDPDEGNPSLGMDAADVAFSMECGIGNLMSQLAAARLEYKEHMKKQGWPEITHKGRSGRYR